MTKNNQIQIFNDRKVRTVWDSETEEWYFSVVDVVGVLTDSTNPTDYLKKMRKREPELGEYMGTNCPQILMTGESGRTRKTLAASPTVLFRIIQSIPSPKAEPFKQWMAQVAVSDYRRLGYADEWINQRLRGIETRKQLTDEWKRGGVKDWQYASLTDIITQQWSGMTTREYKGFKGLHKEGLRDNMTNVELALNMLAEASTTELSKQRNPRTYSQHANTARSGGNVAKAAREELESQLGHSVISATKATDNLISEKPTKEIE